MLQEGHDQAGRVQAVGLQRAQRRADGDGRQELVHQLGARGQAQVAAVDNLQIVVGETDGPKGQRRHARRSRRSDCARSAHNSVGISMPTTIRTPPMVGVPAFC